MTVSVFKSQPALHNDVQMRWMSAGCVNCLGILGVDLGGRRHYKVIKLMLEVTAYFREYLSNTYKIVAPDNLYFDINFKDL